MGDPVTINLRHVARGLGIPVGQIQAAVGLLDDGNSVPFITRYRKDQTGGLDEEQIRQIRSRLIKLRMLAERKDTILRSIEMQGKLTEKLAKQIHGAGTTKRLEDLYLPYKPKKQTLATLARSRGLETLADEIIEARPECADLDSRAADYVNPDRQVPSAADALLGAGHILAERFSENAELRQRLREVLQRTGKLVSSRIGGEAKQTVEKRGPGAPDTADSTPPAVALAQASPPGEEVTKEAPASASLKTNGPTDAAEPARSRGTDAEVVEEPQATAAVEGQPDEGQREVACSASLQNGQSTESENDQVEVSDGQTSDQQDGASADGASADGASADGASADGASADGASADGASADGASADGASADGASADGASADGPHDGSGQGGGEGDADVPAPSRSPGEEKEIAEASEAPKPSGPGESDRRVSQSAPAVESSPQVQEPAQEQPPATPLSEASSQEAAPDQPPAAALLEAENQAVPAQPAAEPSSAGGPRVDGAGGSQPPPPKHPLKRPPKPSAKRPKGRRGSSKKEQKKKARERVQKAFSDYFDYSEEVKKIPPHRTLAINRGERAKVLRVKLDFDIDALHAVLDELCLPEGNPHAEFLRGCARDGLARLILPSLEREIRRELTDRAEAHAVGVFAKNLRNLLLQPPVDNRRILAVDPGYRSGCKLVALDQFGNVLAHDVIYLIGRPERKEKARRIVSELIARYELSAITIGNGSACREAEDFFAELIAGELKDRDLSYVIVNEAGASVYSTSRLGREEFPNYDATLRGAISIGRRLQDPLSELVKIDPANIGVGLYQHDVKAKHLRASLDEVVESCVNYVGVDVNTASPSLLRYLSGLNQLTARRVCEHRLAHGPFRNREQLREVPGFGDATFVQAAGFLKITSGDNPLDATWIHPESYPIAARLLTDGESDEASPAKTESPGELVQRLAKLDTVKLAEELGVGNLLLKDIISQLTRPGRDPREDLPAPIFKRGVLKLDDLSPGMELTGTILNVVDFGTFVDIGMHDSGLVHVSQLADKFVRDPHAFVAVGDIVKVWVVEVDKPRRRVSLTMIPPGTKRSGPRREGKPESRASSERTGKPRGGGRPKGKRPAQSRGKGPPQYRPKSQPKPIKPITKAMKAGREPMRSFSDLSQFLGVTKVEPAQSKKKDKKKSKAKKEEPDSGKPKSEGQEQAPPVGNQEQQPSPPTLKEQQATSPTSGHEAQTEPPVSKDVDEAPPEGSDGQVS